MAGLVTSIFEISLVSSVVIAFILLISPPLSRKYSAKGLCVVWFLLCLRLLIPVNYRPKQPIIEIPAPIQSIIINIPLNKAAGAQTSNAAPDGTQDEAPADAQQSLEQKIPADMIIALVWSAGAFGLLSAHLAGYYLLRMKIRRFSKKIENDKVLKAFGGALQEMNLPPGKITVLEFSGVRSPVMTGFIHPLILLPKRECYDDGELELIFKHELAHYKRKDIWFKLLLTCANCIHWFNPFSYLMVREANSQIESACDQEIVKGKGLYLRKKYCESILSAMERDRARNLGLTTYYRGGKNSMKQRFINIFDQKDKKRGTIIVIASLMLILAASMLVSCTASAVKAPGPDSGVTPPADTQPASPSPSTADEGEAEALKLANDWAEAVKNRDGKAQYALYTKEYQEKVHDEYAGLNWVTGTSSPWVESYTVVPTEHGATVTFKYATSTGPAGDGTVQLEFAEEDGALRISGITETQQETGA